MITVTYEDCALATPIVLTHTVVATPYKPYTEIGVRKKTGGGNCDREVELTTTFQHGGTPSYTDFCNFTGMKARVKTSNVWQAATTVTDVMYKFYDEYDVNRHRMYVPVSTITNKYQVEYADASTALNATAPTDCKHYVSSELTLTKPDLIDNVGVHAVYNGYGAVLQWEHRGKRVQLYGVRDVVTDANPLEVTIHRKDGFQGVKTYTATGPEGLAGTYQIKFPIKGIYKENDIRTGYILIMDVPPGEYIVNIKNNCATRNLPLTVAETPSPYIQIDPLKVEVECSKNGQAGRGKLIYRAVDEVENNVLGWLYVFRDPGGSQPLYKRVNT